MCSRKIGNILQYDLQIEIESNYLYAKISGIRNGKTISIAAMKIIEACKLHSATRAIIDVLDLKGRMSVFESYMFITREFPKLRKFVSLDKVAIVDQKENSERLQFFERTSNKFGFNLKTFTNPDDAREWIIAEL